MTKEEIMGIITRECRDLLDLVADREFNVVTATPEERSQLIRDHFDSDLSGYGIPVEEYIEGLTTEERVKVVNETLASPEYTS